MRGPKPKNTTCHCCAKLAIARGYCKTCYTRLRRQGIIETLPAAVLPMRLTQQQEEILVGLMLGDGCLYRRKPTHKPYLAITRALKDKEYNNWIANALGDLMCSMRDYDIYDIRTKQTYHSSKLITHRSQAFSDWYELWYPKGHKILPSTLTLSPLALAIWFADDGTLLTPNVAWRYRLKLSTHGFSKNEVEQLANLLCVRYQEKFNAQRSEDKYIIDASDAAARAFVREIDVHLPSCMERKAHWRLPQARCYANQPKRASPHRIKNSTL